MRRTAHKCSMVAGLSAVALFGSSAIGKTLVFPHALEVSGRVSDTPYTFDTNLTFENLTGAQGTSSTVDIYWYDPSGQPLTSATGQPVANPHSLNVVSRGPRQTVSLDGMITGNGGFETPTTVKLGFGIIVVGGADPDGVTLQGFVVNSHTSAFDLSVFGFDPVPIEAPAALKSYVIPHVLETSGKITNTQNTFDTQFFMTYVGGLAGAGPAGSVEVTMTLWNTDNTRMTGAGGVLAPVSFTMSASNRYSSIFLEDLINTAGGFGADSSRDGYATIDVVGDTSNFAAESFVQHALSGPNDLAADGGFFPATVPEPMALPLVMGAALLIKRRRRQ